MGPATPLLAAAAVSRSSNRTPPRLEMRKRAAAAGMAEGGVFVFT